MLHLINAERLKVWGCLIFINAQSLGPRTQPAKDKMMKYWWSYGLHKKLYCAEMLLTYFKDNHHSMTGRADKPTDGFIDATLVLFTLKKRLQLHAWVFHYRRFLYFNTSPVNVTSFGYLKLTLSIFKHCTSALLKGWVNRQVFTWLPACINVDEWVHCPTTRLSPPSSIRIGNWVLIECNGDGRRRIKEQQKTN